MDKLLPCPFCGDGARTHNVGAYGEVVVVCDGCSAESPQLLIIRKAIAAWNRRPAPSESEAVKALKKINHLAKEFALNNNRPAVIEALLVQAIDITSAVLHFPRQDEGAKLCLDCDKYMDQHRSGEVDHDENGNDIPPAAPPDKP